MLFDKSLMKKSKSVKSACGKKKSVKAAVDGGWEVPDHLAHEAYDLAEEYFGTDDINQQIVDALSDTELAENLAFIFRMNDFREWDDYLEENYPEDEDDEDDEDIEESVRAKHKRAVRASKKSVKRFKVNASTGKVSYKRRNKVTAAADGGSVTLKGMDTDVIPVADFGCYWGSLRGALEDVFVYDALGDIGPDDEYYDEIMQLVEEKYDGVPEFFEQVLRYAPGTIQEAFNDYDIPATVVNGSCKWYHPREYNFSDDVIEFDMTIDTNWVESKFRELSENSAFTKFIGREFSSRDGFISFMPNETSEYETLLDPNNGEYWKVVSAIIKFIVNEDPSIRDSVTEDLYESLRENADYTTFSSFDIF